ncbi:tyrosine-type recombinase/integrase [Magnetospirillum aberrantis]|uniref:Site-specific integrase n=1 Tax=Magnetospirillum aberrantis SpK TaxID=908842 RepID=A0A7C9UX62_9PROT|nr:site-specific integrase [Magnetospirillum aberrantis]NFV82106.1 site-specific integrase [Magnetospirillum aberrantis SpK]
MGSIVEEKRVGKDGKAVTTYRAHIRRKGFKSQSKTFRTKTDAKEWLRNNEASVLLDKKAKGAGTTFKKLADLFAVAPPMKGTRYWDSCHLDFWIEQFGALHLDEVNHAEINAAVAVLQTRPAMRITARGPKPTGKPLAPSTVNRYLATLSAVMNFALKRGMIDAHPMKTGKVGKLTEGNGRRRILTEAEVTRLLDASEACRWSMMPLFLRMLLTTAARKSEVLNLKWQDVHLTESVAILNETKNGRARALPLVSDVRATLEQASKVRPINSDYVFFDPRHPERPKNVDTIWRFVRKRAGLLKDRDDPLDQVVLHTTRHSAITKMLKGGANLTQAAVVSGHQTLAMLKRYEHLAAQDAVELAERLLGKKG